MLSAPFKLSVNRRPAAGLPLREGPSGPMAVAITGRRVWGQLAPDLTDLTGTSGSHFSASRRLTGCDYIEIQAHIRLCHDATGRILPETVLLFHSGSILKENTSLRWSQLSSDDEQMNIRHTQNRRSDFLIQCQRICPSIFSPTLLCFSSRFLICRLLSLITRLFSPENLVSAHIRHDSMELRVPLSDLNNLKRLIQRLWFINSLCLSTGGAGNCLGPQRG